MVISRPWLLSRKDRREPCRGERVDGAFAAVPFALDAITMRPLPLDSPRPILVSRAHMILKVDAIHTAGVLKPTRDLPLRENQRVRLIVQPIEEPE